MHHGIIIITGKRMKSSYLQLSTLSAIIIDMVPMIIVPIPSAFLEGMGTGVRWTVDAQAKEAPWTSWRSRKMKQKIFVFLSIRRPTYKSGLLTISDLVKILLTRLRIASVAPLGCIQIHLVYSGSRPFSRPQSAVLLWAGFIDTSKYSHFQMHYRRSSWDCTKMPRA